MLDFLRCRFAVMVIALVGLLDTTRAIAQNALSDEGVFVSVPNPITTEAVKRIQNRVERSRTDTTRPIKKVVFDFNPQSRDANTSDFGACYELASYIGTLHELTTIGFVSGNVSGHAVLPVLSCRELVFARNATLGEILPPGAAPPGAAINAGYDEILGNSREGYRAVVRKMWDRSVSLGRGQKNGADYFVDLRDATKLKAAGVVIPDATPLPFAGPNNPGTFQADRLRSIGLVARLADTRREVADAYQLSPASMREDPLSGRVPVSYHYTIRGIVDGATREATTRVIEDMIRQKGNLVFLELECSGGDLSAARDLADRLLKFQEGDNGISIVAFVPNSAPDTAAIIALGCTEIVMSKRQDVKELVEGEEQEAVFGDFSAVVNDANRAELLKKNLVDLATPQGYPLILIDGMLDRSIGIVRVRASNDRSRRQLMTEAQYEGEKANWVLEGTIKPKGQLLKLNATRAVELGIARFATERRDLSEVYNLYGVEPNKVREGTPSWLDRFADFLRRPPVTVLLVVIGFAGLILELKVPGTTIPGIIAALCFILVFWAHSQYSGQTAILGGLVFLLGLILVLIEVFVIPGFGVTGIIGILFMLGGIAFATFDKFPETPEEWTGFAGRIGQYVVSMIAGIIIAFTVARYLPHIPFANRMVLAPPNDSPEDLVAELPGAAVAAALLGAVGVAATPLRPSGMAQFTEQYVDVVTEGGFIPTGARIQVVEVEGNRIVVKEV